MSCPHGFVSRDKYTVQYACMEYNVTVRIRKLSIFDSSKSKHNLNGFLCIHFDPVLLKTWQKLGFLDECECHLLEFHRNVHISQVKVS